VYMHFLSYIGYRSRSITIFEDKYNDPSTSSILLNVSCVVFDAAYMAIFVCINYTSERI
jgi:hypothetical protein